MTRIRLRWLCAAAATLVVACAPGPATAPVPDPAVVDVPRVLVMSAMPIELAPLLEQATIERTVVIGGRTHYLGRLAGRDVVLVAAGISMVNNALAAQAAIDHHDVRAIVYSGIAGGASPEVRIGDVSVPARWAQYQEHVFTSSSRTGWRRGWRDESLGNFGIMFPQRVRVTRPDDAPDDEELVFWFDVDPELLALAGQVAANAELQRCTPAGQCVEHEPTVHVGGNGVSGPTFVDDAAYRDWVWESFAPDGFDMETAAVAHAARANGVPYLGVRSISDLAGGNPNENRVESFAPMAARNAASVVVALLARLGDVAR